MDQDKIEIRGKGWQMMPVEMIRPYERNAKIHSEQQVEMLRQSLRRIGFVRPLLIDSDGNLLAGHGVLMAAKAEGMQQVPCVLVDGLSEQERRAYVHIDNRLAEMSSWDQAVLDLDLRELQDLGIDLSGLGFDALSAVEPICLDDEDDGDAETGDGKERSVMHCPKCGFVFEVSQ